MPAPIDPNIKAAIRRAYIESKLSPAELASQFGVSDRSIQNWAKAEGWDAERKAQNVIEFSRRPKDATAIPRAIAAGNDPREIAEMVIADLQGELATDMSGQNMAAISKELREWIKYREELSQPKTAADFADQLLASGVSIREFVRILKERQAEIA